MASKKPKGKGRKKKKDEDLDESEGDEMEKLAMLGGWVRWWVILSVSASPCLTIGYSLKCPVAAHWGCLAM